MTLPNPVQPTPPRVTEGVSPLPAPVPTTSPTATPAGSAPSTPIAVQHHLPPVPEESSFESNGSHPPVVPPPRYNLRSNRERGGTWKDGPAKDRAIPHHKGRWETGLTCLLALPQFAFQSVHDWSQPPPFISNIGPSVKSRQPVNEFVAPT